MISGARPLTTVLLLRIHWRSVESGDLLQLRLSVLCSSYNEQHKARARQLIAISTSGYESSHLVGKAEVCFEIDSLGAISPEFILNPVSRALISAHEESLRTEKSDMANRRFADPPVPPVMSATLPSNLI